MAPPLSSFSLRNSRTLQSCWSLLSCSLIIFFMKFRKESRSPPARSVILSSSSSPKPHWLQYLRIFAWADLCEPFFYLSFFMPFLFILSSVRLRHSYSRWRFNSLFWIPMQVLVYWSFMQFSVRIIWTKFISWFERKWLFQYIIEVGTTEFGYGDFVHSAIRIIRPA